MRNGGENKTPPLDQQILQPLLAAAFYMTETLGPHVVALRQRIHQDRLASEGPRSTEATLDELHTVLGRHRDACDPLPALGNAGTQARLAMGWPPDDPLLHVSSAALPTAPGASRLAPPSMTTAQPVSLHAPAPSPPPNTARPRPAASPSRRRPTRVSGRAAARPAPAQRPGGPVTPRRARRPPPPELPCRPRGLLAGRVALKHATAAPPEGCTSRPGGAQARLLAEI